MSPQVITFLLASAVVGGLISGMMLARYWRNPWALFFTITLAGNAYLIFTVARTLIHAH